MKLTHKLALPNGQTIELTTAELGLVRDELDRLLGRRGYLDLPWIPPAPPQATTYPPLKIWCQIPTSPDLH